MNNQNDFHTMKGYEISSQNELTPTMEDYLEMICRISDSQSFVRIGELSNKLHVKPSSATKIVQQLKALGYIKFEKYGHVTLTEKGIETGTYLLYRHNVLHDFLCALNNSADELEQVEKIEHFLNKKTIDNIKSLAEQLKNDKT
ncbi:Transcriptional regulator MntR [bioreactor metagenome]|uniref:Transcriptional regulator MntR n=1 Tax=bioreactor metagenome TaxID=1076179 RepID=A0A645G9B6_9ZZZZ|nr:iron dependent repressor, metal binding and dimerization domain protein [Candidatus Metalachnospira sp.]